MTGFYKVSQSRDFLIFRSDHIRMGDNLGGRRHHTNSISKQLNTISDMNVIESSKHLDPLGIFPGGDRTDSENQVIFSFFLQTVDSVFAA